jgi:hypothetical protein
MTRLAAACPRQHEQRAVEIYAPPQLRGIERNDIGSRKERKRSAADVRDR